MSPPELLTASLVMGVGALVQGSVGFGLNVLAAPVLVLIDPALVPGPTLAAALVLTVLLAVRERAAVAWSGVGWALVGRFPGTAVGAVLAASLSDRALALLVGGTVLGTVAISLTGVHLTPDRRTLLGAGALSGILGTATSIGGPPMAMVYQRAPGATLRGTLSGFFAVGTLLSLALLAVLGEYGARELAASAALLPGTVAGFAASAAVARRLPRRGLRAAVLALCAASALVLLGAAR